jgi:hypothetical protein
MDLEQKILTTLGRFAAISRETLKRETLSGFFTFAAEREFDLSLLKLRDAGRVENRGGFFGAWSLATQQPTTTAARSAKPANSFATTTRKTQKTRARSW